MYVYVCSRVVRESDDTIIIQYTSAHYNSTFSLSMILYLHRDDEVAKVSLGFVGCRRGVQFKRVGEPRGWIQLGDEHVVAWSVTLRVWWWWVVVVVEWWWGTRLLVPGMTWWCMDGGPVVVLVLLLLPDDWGPTGGAGSGVDCEAWPGLLAGITRQL